MMKCIIILSFHDNRSLSNRLVAQKATIVHNKNLNVENRLAIEGYDSFIH